MNKLYVRLITFFNSIQSKIAFYPTVLAIAGFLLSFIMLALEGNGISKQLFEILPQLVLEDGDTALTVLSACIGGLISMMVFSFSMVMLLLSQASSNFSPRLLPGLISDKRHQIILGTYLATILYNIFILFSVEPTDKEISLPGFSILMGIILTILCLCIFIYFIHNISQSIQINNILDDIYRKSTERLEYILNEEKEKDLETAEDFSDTSNWYSYKSPVSGYYQNISLTNVVNLAEAEKTRLHFTIPKGFFVLKNSEILRSEKELDEKMVNRLLSNINFARGELVEDNYILAFKQIVEIAVKAMSPGINDPGTAINAIDYLTELFTLRMKKRDSGILMDSGKAWVKVETVAFEDLLYNTMASLRTYCKHDPIMVQKLLWMLCYLKDQEAYYDSYIENIKVEIKHLVKEAEGAFNSEHDKKRLQKYI
ncbi:DUF2254 domain-containing protein [Luteirhabdus pelagi]|uniref:DUF2254 domain-containing protein n=1 Tax=Luteirhabdus pelagi TaxID=2792783 RepID=UPI001939550A|nr:DUF2254 domain-containing protein [Luteirhabdus pelagi]